MPPNINATILEADIARPQGQVGSTVIFFQPFIEQASILLRFCIFACSSCNPILQILIYHSQQKCKIDMPRENVPSYAQVPKNQFHLKASFALQMFYNITLLCDVPSLIRNDGLRPQRPKPCILKIDKMKVLGRGTRKYQSTVY